MIPKHFMSIHIFKKGTQQKTREQNSHSRGIHHQPLETITLKMGSGGKQAPLYTLSVAEFTSEVSQEPVFIRDVNIVTKFSKIHESLFINRSSPGLTNTDIPQQTRVKMRGTFQGMNDKLGGVDSPPRGQLRAIKPSQSLISRKCSEPRSLLLLKTKNEKKKRRHVLFFMADTVSIGTIEHFQRFN